MASSKAIAQHHDVKPENILLGAGSGEILDVMALAFLDNGKKKSLGVEPTYSTVYQRATEIKAEAIKLPLSKDYSQGIPAFIEAANKHAAKSGSFYLCNPNNPTGLIVEQAGSEAAPRRHPEGHAGHDRRGVSPLRARSELRPVGPVRARGPAGGHRADLLEDFRHRRDAARLRDCSRRRWSPR